MEGVAFAFADCQRVLKDAGTDFAAALAVGGGARSETWLRIIASKLDRPLQLAADSDFGAALGAARLGLCAAEGADSGEGLHRARNPAHDRPRPCRSSPATASATPATAPSIPRSKETRMSDFFKGIDPVPFKGPDSDDPLAFRFYEKDRMVLGKRMGDHLRMAVAYWHSFAWPGGDPFGGRTFERPWFGDGMAAAELKAEVAFEMFTILGADSSPSTTATSRPKAAASPRANRNVRADRRHLRREDGGDRRQAALGHRQPVLEPPLHGRRRDQPRPRGLRLRRRAGEVGDRRHPCAERRQLRALGRPRGLRDPAQHRHESRSSTTWAASSRWSSTTSTRSASRARS